MVSVPPPSQVQRSPRSAGHFAVALHAAARLAAIMTLALAANLLARVPLLHVQADATKSRAYSLSPQTLQMLRALEGDWTIALLISADQADVSLRRQVDEVLRQFAGQCPHLHVVRIDPGDPASLGDLELLLERLRATYQTSTDEYDKALDAGVRELDDGVLFTLQQGPRLHAALQRLDETDGRRLAAQQRVNLISLLAEQGEAIRARIVEARRSSGEQPIPDYDTARSVLAETLSQLASEVNDLASHLDRWAEDAQIDAIARQYASTNRGVFREVAQSLTAAADPFRRLQDLELATIGSRLREGELAVVLGPTRAAVIPTRQLFPGVNLRRDEGGVRFDQRFRGEQLIASAIRSLLVGRMPHVVFVHSSPESLLRSRERQIDLAGAAGVLKSAGYEVSEWPVSQSARPVIEADRQVVWVMVPPVRRTRLEPDEQERTLIAAGQALLHEGEAVLLSLYPSLLPKYRQADPWQELAQPFALRADTGRVIVESTLVSDKERRTERGQALQRFPSDHPVARAVDGQQVYLGLPVPILFSPLAAGATREIIAAVDPHANRWQEEDWAFEAEMNKEPTATERFDRPVPVVVAAERTHPSRAGRQRFMLVGSGGWMLSFVADVTVPLGDDRIALANPGNHELLLASVAWLAGLDDLIAPSAISRQVERLDGVTPGVRTWWFWLTMAAIPGACMAIGVFVWLRRRG